MRVLESCSGWHSIVLEYYRQLKYLRRLQSATSNLNGKVDAPDNTDSVSACESSVEGNIKDMFSTEKLQVVLQNPYKEIAPYLTALREEVAIGLPNIDCKVMTTNSVLDMYYQLISKIGDEVNMEGDREEEEKKKVDREENMERKKRDQKWTRETAVRVRPLLHSINLMYMWWIL